MITAWAKCWIVCDSPNWSRRWHWRSFSFWMGVMVLHCIYWSVELHAYIDIFDTATDMNSPRVGVGVQSGPERNLVSISTPRKTFPFRTKVPGSTLCLPWETNVDAWWKYHPTWEAAMTNATHHCLKQISDSSRANLYQAIFDLQFESPNCSNVLTQEMKSSGWGADLAHIADALLFGLEHRRPVQVSKERPWHYAAKKDGSKPVCPLQSIECYFLPFAQCVPNHRDVWRGNDTSPFLRSNSHPDMSSQMVHWLVLYITRPQTWLRRKIFQLVNQIDLPPSCLAFHVRRTDVVLHEEYSRKYHALSEYFDAVRAHSLQGGSPSRQRRMTSDLNQTTVFLMTDDAGTIDEAHNEYPSIRWVYINRTRHKGIEGGFESQIPSSDPASEVIVLLALFQLVPQCHTFVHSSGNLAGLMVGHLKYHASQRNNSISPVAINLDGNSRLSDILSIANYKPPKPKRRGKKYRLGNGTIYQNGVAIGQEKGGLGN